MMYQLLVQLILKSTLALWLLPKFPKTPEISWTSLVTKPKRGLSLKLVRGVNGSMSQYCMFHRHQEVSLLLPWGPMRKSVGPYGVFVLWKEQELAWRISYFPATLGQRTAVAGMTAFLVSLGRGRVESAGEKTWHMSWPAVLAVLMVCVRCTGEKLLAPCTKGGKSIGQPICQNLTNQPFISIVYLTTLRSLPIGKLRCIITTKGHSGDR